MTNSKIRLKDPLWTRGLLKKRMKPPTKAALKIPSDPAEGADAVDVVAPGTEAQPIEVPVTVAPPTVARAKNGARVDRLALLPDRMPKRRTTTWTRTWRKTRI